MARKTRIQYPGALYHVFNRGIDRRDLFRDDRDRYYFLDSLALGVERFHARVHAYCLMTNHFHLLVGTPLGNISHFMQSVQTRYGGHFNLRHGRSGYVYQGPYNAKLVEGNRYLLALSRYIHLNAVRVKKNENRPLKEVVKDLRVYRWSSYREYLGLAKRKEWMEYRPVEEHVKEQLGKRRGAYRTYVERGLVEDDEELEDLMRIRGGMIASREFVRELLSRRHSYVSARRTSFRSVSLYVSPDRILQVVLDELGLDRAALDRRRGSAWARGVAAEMLCVYGGLTQADAARALGMGTGAAVCMRRKALAEQRAKDRRLERRVQGIEGKLNRLLAGL